MAHRDEIQVLKASRRGFKAALTRARNVAESALEDFSVGDDPVLLENFICHWDERLHKYLNAEDQVICHLSSDVKDADPAVDEHTSAFIKAKSQVTGLSRDFDAIRLRNLTVPIQTSSGSNHGHGQTTPGLPRIDAKRPPVLQEDTDHKAFTRWRPLWNNYSRLTFLDQRDQAIQVGLFWECCSGGFLRIVNHSLGIRTDTGRPVKEILDLIEDHLRSLRNVHLDMRDLLAVRQKEGQDYTSFCNIIRELSDYADASKVTEDRLLIALLLQGMRNDSDKAKIMERNPNTFDEARRYILELETARKGARAFNLQQTSQAINSVDRSVHVTKSNYKKNGGKLGKWPEKKPLKKLDSEVCSLCGSSRKHSREDCPAGKTSCHGCGRLGHWKPVCQQKGDKKASSIHLRIASASSPNHGNRIDILVSPIGSNESTSLQFCADTSADVVIMGMNQFRNSNLCQMVPVDSHFDNTNISGVDGRPLDLFGTFKIDLSVDSIHQAQDVTVVVSPDLDDAYLSLDVCRELGIVGLDFPHPKISHVESCPSPDPEPHFCL
ncbi:uncharacterized protein LOC131891250 [Tigriopus californicus]|uniref:uncharacterized protein LOC131891250 n=1 Tax=Tigriopus californicus TaxID=6832 RepID=UPI0027DAAF00|nr:uncharacterized protein LOC131891250 [Tigriopus californicus]